MEQQPKKQTMHPEPDDDIATIMNVIRHGGKPGEGTIHALEALDRLRKTIREARTEVTESHAQHKALGEAYDTLRDERDELNRRLMNTRADTLVQASEVCDTRKKWFDEQRRKHPERSEIHAELRYAGHEAGVCATELRRLAEIERS